MNDTPMVSVVIATYNPGEHLPVCLDSIRQLQIASLEVIVVDGGSTDNTLAFLQQQHWPNLKWISESDKGIYDALNKGARMARGKWIHFLGSDDRLLPGFGEMVNHLRDESTIYYANSQPWYHGDGKPDYILLGGRFNNYRIAKYCVNHQAILYPAKVFKDLEYNLRYKVFADYALNIQLWGNTQFKKQYVPLDIVLYNMNGFSSTLKDVVFKADKPALIKKHLGWWVYARFTFKRLKKKWVGEPDW